MKMCSIIIVAYNEAENLKKGLQSIVSSDFHLEDVEIIVVDNNSTDNTKSVVLDFPEVFYLFEEKKGPSFARNKGILNAKGSILIFLDADTLVSTNWLKNILIPFENPKTGAVGGAILPFNKKSLISQYLGVSLFMRYPRFGKMRKIKGYPSCNLAVRKALVNKGFDTDTFNIYGEDKDLCYQIINQGYEVIFSPEAEIYHQHPETIHELLELLVKSSSGRADFSKKYPFSPDIILFNFHIPVLYPLLVLLCFLFGHTLTGIIILVPALLYAFCNSILSFSNCGRFLLSFIIKPVMDIFSVFILYFFYQTYKTKT